MRSIAATGVPMQRIVYPLRSIAITSSVMYCRFPEFPAGDNGRFEADIEVLDAVVKERLDIRAPFSK